MFRKKILSSILFTGLIFASMQSMYADSFNDGLIELSNNNYDRAIQCFNMALRQNPSNVKAYNNLGLALSEKGDYQNAIFAYQQAIKLDPMHTTSYYNMGLALKKCDRNVEAIESLQDFINFKPEDSDSIKTKWIVNDMREELDNVDKETEKYYLGCYLVGDRNYEDAIKPLQDAINLNSNNFKYHYVLGIAQYKKRQYAEAIDSFSRVTQLNNQYPQAYYMLGECYNKLNSPEAAKYWGAYSHMAPRAESTQKLRSQMASLNQQVNAMNQQNFYNNQLSQNNPSYSPPAGGQQYSNNASPVVASVPTAPTGGYNQSAQMPAQQSYAPMNSSPVVPQYNSGMSGGYNSFSSGPALGTPAARAGKTRIAVLDFDYGGVRPWWQGNWDIGKGIASLVTSELVREGAYSVVERTALDQVLQEQKINNTNLFDPTTAAGIGKLLGVDVLCIGTITQFGIENKKKGFGASIPFIATISNIQSKKSIATVAFNMRLVSVDTGEILDVVSVKGKSKRRGLLIDFAKSGNAGGIDFSSSNFQESVLGEASFAAAENASGEIVSRYNDIARQTMDASSQDLGVVAYIGAHGVIINAGSNSGVKIGNILSIERLSDVVRDPMSGKIIKALTHKIGTFEVKEIDASSATGKMLTGGSPQVGDLVRYRQDMNMVQSDSGVSTSVTGQIKSKY